MVRTLAFETKGAWHFWGNSLASPFVSDILTDTLKIHIMYHYDKYTSMGVDFFNGAPLGHPQVDHVGIETHGPMVT